MLRDSIYKQLLMRN